MRCAAGQPKLEACEGMLIDAQQAHCSARGWLCMQPDEGGRYICGCTPGCCICTKGKGCALAHCLWCDASSAAASVCPLGLSAPASATPADGVAADASDGGPWAGLGGGCWARLSGGACAAGGQDRADRRPLPCASGAVAPELPGGCAGRAGRGRSVGPGAACSVLMYPASLDDYKGSDITHILTGTSEIGHIHWDESIHSLE